MADLAKIVEDLSALTVLEAAELSKLLEEKWSVERLRAEIQRKPRVNRGYQPVQFEDRGDKGFRLTIRLQSNRPQDFPEIKTRLQQALERLDGLPSAKL